MDDIRLLSICSSSATIAISKWAISTIHCSCVQHSRVILSWELSLQARKFCEELPTHWHYPMISNSSCTGWINKRKCKNRCKLLNVSSFEKLNTTKIYKHMHWLQFHSNGLSTTDSICKNWIHFWSNLTKLSRNKYRLLQAIETTRSQITSTFHCMNRIYSSPSWPIWDYHLMSHTTPKFPRYCESWPN